MSPFEIKVVFEYTSLLFCDMFGESGMIHMPGYVFNIHRWHNK